jgi:antitoxin component YwqK of YwqJK toxin-antitoxin module
MLLLRLVILFCLVCSSLKAQDTVVVDMTKSDTTSSVYKNLYYVFNKNGKTEREGRFKDGNYDGRWKVYFVNGNLESIIDYHSEGNQSIECGLYEEYYENGKLKEEGRYKLYPADSLECVSCQEFRIGGKVVEKAEMERKIRVGEWREYFESGKLKAAGEYYLGVHQTYDEGDFTSEENTSHGFLHVGGVGTDYLKQGSWRVYDDTGFLLKYEHYRKGILIGVKSFNSKDQYVPVVSVNGLVELKKPQSNPLFMGDLNSKLNRDSDFPHAYFLSKDGTQYLKVSSFPGEVRNSIDQVEIGFAVFLPSKIKTHRTCTEFGIWRVLQEGETEAQFIESLWCGHTLEEKDGMHIYHLGIRESSQSDYLKQYKMGAYFQDYYFQNGLLVKYDFGFKCP